MRISSNSRKGTFETMAVAIVTFMLVGLIATIANSMLVDVGGVIRSESVGMASERMERTVYGVSAMDDIKLQLDYGRGYALFKENKQYYISFTFNGEREISPFDPPDSPGSFNLRNEESESPSRFYCLNKTSGDPVVHIYRSKC